MQHNAQHILEESTFYYLPRKAQDVQDKNGETVEALLCPSATASM